jgi:NitT/TauT family transport system substrate-binding protein
MRFRRYRVPTVAAVVVSGVSALVAGCMAASAGSAGSGALEKTNIVVEDYPTVDSAGLYIAEQEGLFKQQGLNVKIQFAPASELTVNSAVNGTADIAISDYVTYIDDEVENDDKLRIVAEASTLQPNDMVLLTPPGSQIKTLAQLEGQTIAVQNVGNISTLLIRALLTEDGIRTRDVDIEQGFTLLNVAQQLAAGQTESPGEPPAAAAPIPEPFASEGEQQYGLQELADIDEGGTKNFPLEGYAVTQSWAKKYPNTLAAFLRALDEGQEIADRDRAAVETALEKFLGISAATAAVIALPDYPLAISDSQLQRVVDTMVQFSLLPSSDLSFKMSGMTG